MERSHGRRAPKVYSLLESGSSCRREGRVTPAPPTSGRAGEGELSGWGAGGQRIGGLMTTARRRGRGQGGGGVTLGGIHGVRGTGCQVAGHHVIHAGYSLP